MSPSLALVYDGKDKLMLRMLGDFEDCVCTHPWDFVVDSITCDTISFLKAKIRPVPIIFDHALFVHNRVAEDVEILECMCSTDGEYLTIDELNIKDIHNNGIPTGSSMMDSKQKKERSQRRRVI